MKALYLVRLGVQSTEENFASLLLIGNYSSIVQRGFNNILVLALNLLLKNCLKVTKTRLFKIINSLWPNCSLPAANFSMQASFFSNQEQPQIM